MMAFEIYVAVVAVRVAVVALCVASVALGWPFG